MSRILVVDGNPHMAEMFARTLRSCGHEPTAVEEGAEALRMLKSQTDAYDLIITATNTGRSMHGIRLIEKVRSETTYTKAPIMLLTGYDEDAIRRVFGISMRHLKAVYDVTYADKTADLDKLMETIEALARVTA